MMDTLQLFAYKFIVKEYAMIGVLFGMFISACYILHKALLDKLESKKK